MSFILVSAVAFATYMRYSRLPSSYLRRTSSSRLLVKAALAEAIDAVDSAIGNCPYPDIYDSATEKYKSDGQDYFNRWSHRVFLGSTNRTTTVSDSYVSSDDTVSTLTVEGLAYIPPPFINEVRVLSRRTATARWHSMGFDAGRYAFCAIDVSDCFDVNRLEASIPRSSADEDRITLGQCFENAAHTGYTVDPNAWDTFIDNYIDDAGTKVPLVSVADLNLAIWDKKPSAVPSPFCDYIENNGTPFYTGSGPQDTSANAQLLRGMAFVTDSWFVPSNSTANVIDLSRAKDQPFYNSRMASSDDKTKNDDTFDQIVRLKNNFWNKYACIAAPEMVQLYDYLDRDSVPLSLALPTAERTPMITGVSLEGNLSLIVAAKRATKEYELPATTTADGKVEKHYARVTTYNLTLAGNNLTVGAGFVYPFKYKHDETKSFKAQAAMSITFVPKGNDKYLRRSNAKWPAVIDRAKWQTSSKAPALEKYGSEKTAVVVNMQSDQQSVNVPSSVTEEENALISDLRLSLGNPNVQIAGEFDALAALSNVNLDNDDKNGAFRQVQIVKKDEDGNETVESDEFQTSIHSSAADLSGVEANVLASGTYYVPVIQTWVRIVDDNSKVVDLVPAYYNDDESVSQMLPQLITSTRERPVLRFYLDESANKAEDVGITADGTKMAAYGTKQLSFYPKAYVADDPRFNYAPENMAAVSSSDLSGEIKDYWYKHQRSGSRDGDIFMMTSDAGYLQSPYELTALLDVCGFSNAQDLSIVNDGYNGEVHTLANLPAGDAMWRTYSQYSCDGNSRNITAAFPTMACGENGFRINPYTSDESIFMAALANTPLDWWAASPYVKSSKVDLDADPTTQWELTEANKYTFSKHAGAQVQVEYGKTTDTSQGLMALAKKMMSAFQSKKSGNWQDAYDGDDNPNDDDDLNWTEEDKIAGVDLGVSLHSVDKKFLHGFWRGCFANRQHLFLIFVRAEPMMMGSGATGQMPPQLGARAVALVWRDPTPTQAVGNSNHPRPHRTRLLFYRQLE